MNKYRSCEDAANFERFRKRAKSLVVVAPTAPEDNYNDFTEKVKDYNAKEPFNFVTSNILKPLYYETVSLKAYSLAFDIPKQICKVRKFLETLLRMQSNISDNENLFFVAHYEFMKVRTISLL